MFVSTKPKLSLSSGCSCPNRDGSLSVGGCSFCSEGGSGDFAAAFAPIDEQLEEAKAAVDKPFPLEEDLAAKSARLVELNALLNMDKPENEIVDGDRSDEDSAPSPEHNLER